jgi:4-hydroxythreonine-4-phosphate dehydrogenase
LNLGVNDDKVGQYAVKSFIATDALRRISRCFSYSSINKYNIQSEEFKFPGHTDYLNQELEGML